MTKPQEDMLNILATLSSKLEQVSCAVVAYQDTDERMVYMAMGPLHGRLGLAHALVLAQNEAFADAETENYDPKEDE